MQRLVCVLSRVAVCGAVWSALAGGCAPPAIESVAPRVDGGSSGAGGDGSARGRAPGPLAPLSPDGSSGGARGGGETGGAGGAGGAGTERPDAGADAGASDAGGGKGGAGGTSAGGTAPRTDGGALVPTGLRILYRCAMGAGMTTSVGLQMTLKNEQPIPVDLKSFKIRYWITTDNAPMFAVRCEQVQAGQALNCASATVALVPVDPPRPGADAYIEVGFSKGGLGYTASVPVTVRLNASAPGFNLGNDYSCYTPPGTPGENERVTAYVDGQLIWGKEP